MDTQPDETKRPVPGSFTALVAELGEIAAEVDAAPEELSAASRRRLVRSLAGTLGRVEAVFAESVRAMSRNGDHALDGARGIGAWVASRTEISAGHASEADRMARDLEDLPAVARAWRTGRLGTAKVRMFLKIEPALRALLIRDQADLVLAFTGKTVASCARALARWREGALGELDRSPDDPPPGREQPVNSLKLTAGIGGERHALGIFDALTGAEVKALLTAEIDRAHRAGELDRSDGKTLNERQADALLALLRRGAAAPDADATRAHVVVNIQIDLGWLLGISASSTEDLLRRPCQTADGSHMPLGQVLAALDEATINLILGHLGLDGVRFNPVGEITTRRLASASQRRMLLARDETCRWPGCDAPASWTRAHHEPPWSVAPQTSVPHLVLLCPFHHRLRHDEGFGIRIDDEGDFIFERPDRVLIDDAPPGELIEDSRTPLTDADIDRLIARRFARLRPEAA